jgi:hypothetical protein
MKAELKLWLNVLTRNILDSTGLTSPNPDQEDKRLIKEAELWLKSPSFYYICGLCELEADYILKLHDKIKEEDKSQSERIFSVFYNRLARLKGIEDDYIFN